MSAVALTGGIASGKSTVAGILKAHAIPLLDTDEVAANISGPGGLAIPALVDAFGPACVTPEGGLDRPRMRAMAFSDDAIRQRLERILHPLIRMKVEEFLSARAQERCAVAIPLYFESLTYRNRFSQVVLVDCATSVQRERLVHGRQMAPDIAEAILRVQASRFIRLQLADRVLVNNAGLGMLDEQVARWIQSWK